MHYLFFIPMMIFVFIAVVKGIEVLINNWRLRKDWRYERKWEETKMFLIGLAFAISFILMFIGLSN